MEVNKLRIGNYINDSDMGVCNVNMSYLKDINNGYTDYKLIPLTEQWLLNLDFERGLSTMTLNYYSKCGSVSVFKMPNGNIFADGFISDIKLNSVDQLQNLYFELTGEELIIK